MDSILHGFSLSPYDNIAQTVILDQDPIAL